MVIRMGNGNISKEPESFSNKKTTAIPDFILSDDPAFLKVAENSLLETCECNV